MTDLDTISTEDLLMALAERCPGHVIGVQLNGPEGEYITKVDTRNVLATLGLFEILKCRLKIYLEDTTREGYEEMEDD